MKFKVGLITFLVAVPVVWFIEFELLKHFFETLPPMFQQIFQNMPEQSWSSIAHLIVDGGLLVGVLIALRIAFEAADIVGYWERRMFRSMR